MGLEPQSWPDSDDAHAPTPAPPEASRHPPVPPPARASWFFLGCAFEAALLAIAAGLGWLLQRPCWADLHWATRDVAFGILASLPPLTLFVALLRSSWQPLQAMRSYLEREVAPVFADWSLLQLAIISLLAGLGEEVLFRGVIQSWLSQTFGTVLGLAMSSILFGCAHPLTRTYVVIAAVVGAYLGSLQLFGGNLLIPITTHAVYDFIALVYFLRIHAKLT